MIIVSPRKAMTMKASIRRILGSRWKKRTRYETERVKIVKLSMTPRVIPSGLWCPLFPAIEEDRTIGSTGQIHGAKIVTKPAENEKKSNKIIRNLYSLF